LEEAAAALPEEDSVQEAFGKALLNN